MKRILNVILCSLLAIFALSIAFAEETNTPPPVEAPAPAAPFFVANTDVVIRPIANRSVANWVTGQLEVAGVGYAVTAGKNARKKARATAMTMMTHEARRSVANLQLDGAGTLGTLPPNDASSEALIANLTVVSERWDAITGRYTVIGVLPLYGPAGVTSVVAAMNNTFTPLELPEDQYQINANLPWGQTAQRFAEPYTGLIVCADQVLLTPCLFPRLLRFDGKELWGPAVLTPETLAAGPVRYARSLDAAIATKLAGERPMIVTAIGSGQGGNPVISLDDVYNILVYHKRVGLLDRLPVVIVARM